ncbi:ankyrin repeat-containing domain protein [Flagelloscypha sp. PMI_526]|nr:ankyrin repeat-containing domain protein [Flagelloscypha sp. PMI_526]
MTESGKGIRVYSFDGPALDSTGLSELLILENIAGRWVWDVGDEEREGEDVRASEICEIVCGTGLGGFYAILFSLHLTIGQVIAAHTLLQKMLFSSKIWEQKNVTACLALLNETLAQAAGHVGLTVDLDSPFLSKTSLKCCIFVLNNLNTGHARALRNYRIRTSKSLRCTIRQAIHATLADGVHLPYAVIEDEHFMNASSGYANPSYELMKELPHVFPRGSKLASLVNLGAGHRGLMPLTTGGSWNEQNRLLHYAEGVAQNLAALCAGLGPCYFRLSVTAGAINPTEWSSTEVDRVVKSCTAQYLAEVEVEEKLDAVVVNLNKRNGMVLLERLGSLAAEDGKASLIGQIEVVRNDLTHIKVAMEKDIYRLVEQWLTPIDQTAKLDASMRTRSSSTCTWLFEHPEIVRWRELGGIFWCHAGMGTGKTTLMSYLLYTLRNLPEKPAVAFYYFEFTNPSTLSEEALFRALVSQLSHLGDTIVRRIYDIHRYGSVQPQLTSLHAIVHNLVTAASSPVYIIIDALDELPAPQRKYLLDTLLKLFPPALHGVHLIMTSRDEVDIHELLSGKIPFNFVIDQERVKHDIAAFVDQEIAFPKWQSWPKKDIQLMRDTLIQKTDGMFRMVACQFEVLNRAQTTEDMLSALASLPSTLGQTYLYCLDGIHPDHRNRAHTLFCILSAAFAPISIAELSALLAVKLGDEDDADYIPVFLRDRRYHQLQNLTGLGTALVHQTLDWCEEPALQFAHASVKEFFLQPGASHSWRLDDHLIHVTTARACLALLIHNEDSTQWRKVLDIHYTLQFWCHHISFRDSAQLLGQQKVYFRTFPWSPPLARSHIRPRKDLNYRGNYPFPESPLAFAAGAGLEQLLQAMLNEHSSHPPGDLYAALHYAAVMGAQFQVFTALVEKGGDVNTVHLADRPLLIDWAFSRDLPAIKFLVNNGADVNELASLLGSPLQAAALRGAVDIVQYLLGAGANVNAQGGLHGSALQAATWAGHVNVVECLVENGADVNLECGDDELPLQLAAKRGSIKLVELLVERGADVNLHKETHGSALQAAAAARQNIVEYAEFEKEFGAVMNWEGRTFALEGTVNEDSLDVVKFLVRKGADVNIQGGQYGSALQAAVTVGDLDMVKFLVENGADVNNAGGYYGSALQAAAANGTLEMVKFLAENGAELNIDGGTYGSAVQAAASRDALDIVKFLVENGADVNKEGGQYGSALHAAAFKGAFHVVRYLVENGAEVNTQRGTDESAVHAAFVWKHLNITEFLIEHGAYLNIRGERSGYLDSLFMEREFMTTEYTSMTSEEGNKWRDLDDSENWSDSEDYWDIPDWV